MHDSEQNKATLARLLKGLPVDGEPLPFDPGWLGEEPRSFVDPSEIVSGGGRPIKYYLLAALLPVVASFVFYLYSITNQNPAPRDSGIAIKGIVSAVHGEVGRVHDSREVSVHNGDLVGEGDLIRTAAGGSVDVMLPDGISVRIKENSEIRLTDLFRNRSNGREIKIQLEKGLLYAMIQKLHRDESFRVTTPTAIAGVRGTSFSVETDGSSTEVELYDGSVAVSVPKETATEEVLAGRSSATITLEKGVDVYPLTVNKEKENEMLDLARTTDSPSSKIFKLGATLEPFQNEKQLEAAYNRQIEVVRLTDGRELEGVVISQVEGHLIVHTVDGGVILHVADVIDIRYRAEEVAP